MKIKAVLFDIDGTLVDSNEQHVSAWKEAFARFGWTLAREAIRAQVGKGSDMLVPALLPATDEATRQALAAAHGEIFTAMYLPFVRPFPAASDLLRRTQEAGKQVVLASSAAQSDLDHYLDLLEAHGIVSETTSADDVEHTKPAPDIFASALGKLSGTGPDQVIVVGDTPYDIEAAMRCGIAAIGLRSGKFPDARLLEPGAIALYDDAADLLAGFAHSPLAA